MSKQIVWERAISIRKNWRTRKYENLSLEHHGYCCLIGAGKSTPFGIMFDWCR